MSKEKSYSGYAITSLVLGLAPVCGFGFSFVPQILAIIFSVIAMKKMRVDPLLLGKGMATAGFVLGIVMIVVHVLIWLIYGAIIIAAIGAAGK